MTEYATPPRSGQQAQLEQRTTIRIEVAPDGLHITAEYTGQLASIPQAIERLRAAGVLDLVQASRPGTSAQASLAPAGQRKPSKRIEPEYNADGDALCPKHQRPLKEGKFGRYCPAKDDSTERGFCSLRFAE